MPLPRIRRLRGLAALAVTAAVCGTTAFAPAADAPQIDVSDQRITVGAEPDGTAVELDTRLYVPHGGGPHPAILLAHGFGGSKDDLEVQARRHAAEGFAVLAFTARGFGASGGRIHLNSPDYEVKDAQALLDFLAQRTDVTQDGPGDPRVGVAGVSYGGAIGLMLAGADQRVDSVVAGATWSDLAKALFPNSLVGSDAPGPYKQLWGSRFFGASLTGAGGAGGTAGAGGSTPGAAGPNALCGRFDPTLCRELQAAAEAGRPSTALVTELRRNSPLPTMGKVAAPTLLVQGESDSLFGLEHADANAAALAATGTRLAVRWTDGGHDGPTTNQALDDEAVDRWLTTYLRGSRTDASPVPAFSYALPVPRRADNAPLETLDAYPGLRGTLTDLPLSSPANGSFIINPPGGQPNSMTSVPGLSSLGGLPTYRLAALPGMSAAFDTPTISRAMTVAGAPRVELEIVSTGSESTIFVSLWRIQGEEAVQPRTLTAPVRVALQPGQPTKVGVDLPPSVWTLAEGSRWRVLVTSTDNAFSVPREARADRIRLVSARLGVPTVQGTPVAAVAAERDTESWAVGGATLGLLALVGVLAALRRRRRTREHVREEYADVPLVVDGLVKTYADGHRAVDDVSWRAERGQVVGLLGPNGAGKTTTMRMLLGLITPDSGEVHVLGRPVHSGSEVLGRVGALVEGPGFLPHLTGRQNLHAYWRATGRPEAEAEFDDALAVAALGGALDRPVRTYSHGMKQRLGIAQAMLGKPELLFLDEPTNGLDPPQIAAMRPILQDYAATGRTVVVSSHLLAEVEMTCSHVVVMNAGRVITAGTVADLIASEDTTVFEFAAVSDLRRAQSALEGDVGIRTLEAIDDPTKPMLTVVADRPREQIVRAVVESGASVVGVGSRRHLEEVFLGVIANSSGDPDGVESTSVIERLRQVRAR